jgi:hypothetical protein
MKKALLLIFLLGLSLPCRANEPLPTTAVVGDILFMRPSGLILTLVGSALFVGLSPLTAIAAISPPHDAFEVAADVLVLRPANFTFNRPVGVMEAGF